MAKKDGIYKRGNTYWITFTDAGGKRRWESSKSKYYAAADTLLSIRKTETAQGKLPEILSKRQQTTFRELATRYLDYCQHQKDILNKRNRLDKFIIPYFGDRLITSIKLADIETFYSNQLSQCKTVATANRRLEIVKNIWTKAVEWGLLPEDHLKMARKVKKQSERESWRIRYLEKHEAVLLLDACNEITRQIVACALSTGMRKDELFELTWDDVRFDTGFTYVRKSKNSDQRQIPISEELNDILMDVRKAALQEAKYVFPGKNGGKRTDVKKSFESACKKAGITNFRFHDLRHTFASWLVMAGVDITTVSRLLGHKSLAMTLRYSHLAPNHLQLAVASLPKLT